MDVVVIEGEFETLKKLYTDSDVRHLEVGDWLAFYLNVTGFPAFLTLRKATAFSTERSLPSTNKLYE